MTKLVDLEIAGERLLLHPERALFWPAARTLFVADVHLGKAESFRALGVPVPQGPTQSTLVRLTRVLDATAADRLVVLGDLLHARHALEPATLVPLRRWRAAHAGVEITLVRGNHDDHAGDPPRDLTIHVVDALHRLGPFLLCHESPATGRQAWGYPLAGHLHPAVRIGGRAHESLRLPCFWFGEHGAVLPAFGDFTGGASFERRVGDRVFCIADERVFEVPAR
jgi:uncharacterized protein